jgi:hypothetical protein
MPDIKYAISTTRWRPRSGHARAKGISLEAEVRRTLAASVAADRAELVRRARALHAAQAASPASRSSTARASSAPSAMPGDAPGPEQSLEKSWPTSRCVTSTTGSRTS